MRARSVVAFAVAMGLLAAACGGSESAGTAAVESTNAVATPLLSLADWCSRYEETLPALSSPNPDGRELEVLDLYVARYAVLAAGAPGVPESAMGAIGQFAAAFAAIRDRVAKGENLPDVLAENYANDQSDFIVTAKAADAEVTALCS